MFEYFQWNCHHKWKLYHSDYIWRKSMLNDTAAKSKTVATDSGQNTQYLRSSEFKAWILRY